MCRVKTHHETQKRAFLFVLEENRFNTVPDEFHERFCHRECALNHHCDRSDFSFFFFLCLISLLSRYLGDKRLQKASCGGNAKTASHCKEG